MAAPNGWCSWVGKRARSIEIMLSGRMVDATEAHTMGLVNYIVVEPNELLTKTRELLSIINEKAPIAIARIIELANLAAGDSIELITGGWEADPFGGDAAEGDDDEDTEVIIDGFCPGNRPHLGNVFGTADMKEGGQPPFSRKRKPHFQGGKVTKKRGVTLSPPFAF